MSLTLCRSQLNDRNNDFPFFDRDTATVDCNVATTSQAIEQWNGTKLDAKTIRKKANQGTGPTGHTLARRTFQAAGMVALTDYRMLREVDAEDVRELLRAGWFVCLFVDCGALRRLAPELVGDRNYSGAHAVGLGDFWRGSQGASVHLANPLFDGRKRGAWTAPKGVQVAKFSYLRDAGFAYTGGITLAGWATARA